MAAPANTFTTGSAVGNRESLHDKIYMLNKDEFPFMSSVGEGRAASTYEEWQTDDLGNGDDTNANLEGDDSTNAAVSPTVRVGNRMQIVKKVFQISRTQEQVKKAGRSSEIGMQTMKQSRQIKMDVEKIVLKNQASNSESGSTPRHLGGMLAWLTTNVSRGSGGSSGGFSAGTVSAATNGTQRTFTETLGKSVIKTIWDNGGRANQVLVNSGQKQVMSGFAGIATQYQQANGKKAKIVAAADVYISDFGDLKIIPDRYMSTRDALIYDPDMASLLWLSKIKREQLAKTGDATKYHLVGEVTLQVDNEKAHGVVADLT